MSKRSGQGLVEYLILVCLIAVSSIAIVGVIGTNIREQYANISNSISGDKRKVKLTHPDARSYQSHGMDDFMEGADVRP